MKKKIIAFFEFLSKYIPPAQPGINHWGAAAFPVIYVPPVQEVENNKTEEEKSA